MRLVERVRRWVHCRLHYDEKLSRLEAEAEEQLARVHALTNEQRRRNSDTLAELEAEIRRTKGEGR